MKSTIRVRKRPLTAALVVGLGLGANALTVVGATRISVTTTGDAGASGTCTLRQAIVSMNTGTVAGTSCLPNSISGSGNSITFDTTLFPNGGTNTITLADTPDNSLTITAPSLTIDASANGNMTVQRSRPSTDNTNAFRILYDYAASSSLVLNNLTISNGNVRATTYVGGGGIACNCASLTLINSVVSGNAVYGMTTNSSGTKIPTGFGGGVFVYGASLTVDHSTISDNSAYGYGGGIAALPFSGLPNVTLSNSTIGGNNDTGRHGGGAFLVANISATDTIVRNNATTGNGGGLHVSGTLTMTRSSVTGNTAGNNGGGMKIYATTTLTNSTISGNTASNNGGGICDASGYYSVPSALLTLNGTTLSDNRVTNSGSSHGGGIFTRYGNLSFINSTIAANSSSLYGGGIYVRNNTQPIMLRQTTIASNTAGVRGGGLMIMTSGASAVTFNGSLFTYSGAPTGGGGNIAVTTGGITIAGTNNLVFGGGLINVGFTTPPLTGSPMLQPLADNGGPTQTLLPQPASPAIDAGDDAGCPTTDQRGVRRPQGAHCDIGAVEVVTDRIFANNFDGTPTP